MPSPRSPRNTMRWEQSSRRKKKNHRSSRITLGKANRLVHPAQTRLSRPRIARAEELAAAADRTWELASQQEALSNFDKRIETNKELSAVYSNWIESVANRQRAVLHRALNGVLMILAIVLIGIYFMTVLDKVVGRLTMDRRQTQSLRTVAHVSLRVATVLVILLVIMGPPGQLGTFLGLAGAGLTVALKDFIVGFLGWFVLMGKNGVRLGDWVEINGVTGEVVELGMFHTVLLETGNWTDSGHPTGRRVTFTNSYAIEGHYFNFSTSGQWMWDELQVVLPVGQDPYPIIDAIQKKVTEATTETAKQAEQEWKNAASSRQMNALSAAPAINVRPVVGGIEIAVRYITRANERYQLRAKLYEAAVELLGQKAATPNHEPDAQSFFRLAAISRRRKGDGPSLCAASCAHLFRCKPVQRRSGHAEHCKVKINLSAMMDFMFDHQAQPFPFRNVSAVRRLAFALQVFVGQFRENVN